MRNRFLIAVCLAALLAPAARFAHADKKPWKDQSVDVGDIKVHYLEAGAGDRHLIFIPGWTMTAEVWAEQIPYFAARGFHVIALDPRSQGLTTRTEGGNTYHQQAADLNAFVSTLDLEHPYLVGWSEGVVVLLEYISSPEARRPQKLAMVDGSPGGLKEADYPGGFTLQEARTLGLDLQQDREKTTDRYVRSLFRSRQREALYKELVDGSMRTPAGTAAALLFDLLSGDRRTALLRIDVPTLVVATDETRLLGEYMQSKITGSELEVIEGAGHALFLEKPQAFNQTLETFLNKP